MSSLVKELVIEGAADCISETYRHNATFKCSCEGLKMLSNAFFAFALSLFKISVARLDQRNIIGLPLSSDFRYSSNY
jgi:hypothetical protein